MQSHIAHPSRWNLCSEETINLIKRLALEFGNVEEASDGTDQSQTSENKADLSLEIRLIYIQLAERNSSMVSSTKATCARPGTDAYQG